MDAHSVTSGLTVCVCQGKIIHRGYFGVGRSSYPFSIAQQVVCFLRESWFIAQQTGKNWHFLFFPPKNKVSIQHRWLKLRPNKGIHKNMYQYIHMRTYTYICIWQAHHELDELPRSDKGSSFTLFICTEHTWHSRIQPFVMSQIAQWHTGSFGHLVLSLVLFGSISSYCRVAFFIFLNFFVRGCNQRAKLFLKTIDFSLMLFFFWACYTRGEKKGVGLASTWVL